MHRELESVFAELGLAHYLDAFVDQGFDSWETILDIQESDLDALGVKLGHRRKLQRRIANARGIAPSISLVSALKPGSEEGKQQHLRRDNPTRSDAGSESTNGVTKRKYRRHPKPDEHAPERPPSAYVLFSNKMREDLKSHNLSFTEIAKLVGENWQNLDQAERESFENQANVAKDKYRRSLAEYKKTSEYRRYAQYLQEFKEKQNKHNQGSKAHLSTDTSKRQRFDGKREAARLRHDSSYGSTTSGGTNGTPSSGASGTASGSSSERLRESEPPPYRRRRVDSIASIAESQASSTAPTALSQRNSLDENAFSPRSSHIDGNSPVDGRYSQHSAARYDRSNPSEHPTMPQQLPSLSDMLDKDNQQGISGRLAPDGSPSMGMGSSTSYPAEDAVRRSGGSKLPDSRPISEGALPIHALLSNQATSSARYAKAPQQRGTHMPNSKNTVESPHVSPGYGFLSNSPTFRHMKTEQSGDGDVVMTTERSPTNTTAEKGRFDGMSALLQAGEIVGRRGGRR